MSNIKTIGVFFGGKSPEHDISIITGQLIMSELKKNSGYKIVPVYLDKEENFHIDDKLDSLNFFTDPYYEKDLRSMEKFYLDLEFSKNKIVFKGKNLFASKRHEIDLVFPAFHGNLGEDGSMQGLFEILNVPYVGCGVAASAVAMDKIMTKIFYEGIGVPTTKFLYCTKHEWQENKTGILENIKSELKWPVFVKPPALGSSIGIAKVKNYDDLENAIEVVFHYDVRALVEESVENLMDVTCAVIGNHELTASLLQESTFSSDLFSYEDKYLEGGGAQLGKAEKKLVIPARLGEGTTSAIQELSKKAYKALGCAGIARVDFLYNKITKEFFANEINPLPGTLYHHLWQKSGIDISELIKLLIKFALERHEEKSRITYAFSSSLLASVKGMKLKK